MKRFLCILLILSIITLAGCTVETPKNESSIHSRSINSIEQLKEDAISSDTYVPNETPEEKAVREREILVKYTKMYNTNIDFSDMYVAEKHLLIGDEVIVELFVIGDFCNVVSISKKNIERIEHSVFEEFASVTIYDKTKQTISLTVTPENLNKILEFLN